MLRRTSIALPLILAVALVVRVAAIVATPHFAPIFDAHDYDRHALSIAHGHGYPDSLFRPGAPTAFRPPLYPVLLAGVYALGRSWTAGRLLGALLGVAAVALVFLIATRLWGRRVGLVSAALAAVFPPLVLYSASLLSEPLFILLVLAALFATLEYRRTHRMRWAVGAGVLCGLGALTRGNGALLVIGAGGGAWIARPRFSRAGLAAPAVVVLAAVVTIAPWVIRNTIVFHRFVGVTDQAGVALAGTYNSEARHKGDLPGRSQAPHQLRTFQDLFKDRRLDEVALTSRLTSRALRYMVDHPGRVVETSAWNTLRVFEIVRDDNLRNTWEGGVLQAVGVGALISPVIPASVYVALLLALVGAATQFGVLRAKRAPPFVWWFPLLMVAPAIVIWGLSRYRAPVDPFLVMLAALGVVALADWASERRALRRRRVAASEELELA
jgi:4-amino-4-deoxy-L-arabinose transferase-like glycosyltransferase